MNSSITRKIFGDFQTPVSLATEMCTVLGDLNIKPDIIIEPTCGKGNILLTAMEYFNYASKGIGIEINQDYIDSIRNNQLFKNLSDRIDLFHADFFKLDLSKIGSIEQKNVNELLIIGNPPWVTNSELGCLNSQNLPKKSNLNSERGIDAITGKSNFDISEYIVLELLKKYSHIRYTLAILCKTSVARKILIYAWKNKLNLSNEKIFSIDAIQHFGTNVDAGMLFFQNGSNNIDNQCDLYKDLTLSSKKNVIGYSNTHLVSNIGLYEQSKHIEGKSPYVWRNGLKHDASKVMEFTATDNGLLNGFNEKIDIEPDLIFPFLKSADIANGAIEKPRKYVLITQRFIGEETRFIRYQYPKTWDYLEKHQDVFNKRKSSIYKNKPKYSIFSVGEYTFAPFKIAISSFYKKISFKLISKYNSKPYVLDDTCNFIPTNSLKEAELLLKLLTTKETIDFINSIVFWDAKRVITTEILNRIDINKIAEQEGIQHELEIFQIDNKFIDISKNVQLSFF
jgi:methylase of polypeptide subunit release factors